MVGTGDNKKVDQKGRIGYFWYSTDLKTLKINAGDDDVQKKAREKAKAAFGFDVTDIGPIYCPYPLAAWLGILKGTVDTSQLIKVKTKSYRKDRDKDGKPTGTPKETPIEVVRAQELTAAYSVVMTFAKGTKIPAPKKAIDEYKTIEDALKDFDKDNQPSRYTFHTPGSLIKADGKKVNEKTLESKPNESLISAWVLQLPTPLWKAINLPVAVFRDVRLSTKSKVVSESGSNPTPPAGDFRFDDDIIDAELIVDEPDSNKIIWVPGNTVGLSLDDLASGRWS